MSIPFWIENIIYNIGDIVCYNKQSYKCLQTHLSEIRFIPSNEPRLWTKNYIALELNITVYDWKPSTYFFKDDVVLFMNNVFKCNKHHISNPFLSPGNNSSYWSQLQLPSC
jgi:hypothetical protein